MYLKITWLQDTNYAKTSGYATGKFTSDQAAAWVDQLAYAGFGDQWPSSASSHPQQGHYQTSSNLDHLPYLKLQLPAATSSISPRDTGPVIHLDHGWYWLDSTIEPNQGEAWYSVFNKGPIHETGKDNGAHAWAVRNGAIDLW